MKFCENISRKFCGFSKEKRQLIDTQINFLKKPFKTSLLRQLSTAKNRSHRTTPLPPSRVFRMRFVNRKSYSISVSNYLLNSNLNELWKLSSFSSSFEPIFIRSHRSRWTTLENVIRVGFPLFLILLLSTASARLLDINWKPVACQLPLQWHCAVHNKM